MKGNALATSLLALWLAAAGATVQQGAPGPEPPELLRLPAPDGEVVFPHRAHTDDFGVECKVCHHELNARPLNTPHEGYLSDVEIDCQGCHGGQAGTDRPVLACSRCHQGSAASRGHQTLSAKAAIHQSCWACHEVRTGAQASKACPTCHAGGAPRGSATELSLSQWPDGGQKGH